MAQTVDPGVSTLAVGALPVQTTQTFVAVDWTVLVPIIVAGICMVITTTFTAFSSFKNGRKSDAIHVLVNSGMTKALADLAAAQEEIRELRTLVTALNTRIVAGSSDYRAQATLASAAVAAAQAASPDRR